MKQKTIDGIIHIKIAAVFKETVFHTEFTLTISVHNTNICAWTSKLKQTKPDMSNWYLIQQKIALCLYLVITQKQWSI